MSYTTSGRDITKKPGIFHSRTIAVVANENVVNANVTRFRNVRRSRSRRPSIRSRISRRTPGKRTPTVSQYVRVLYEQNGPRESEIISTGVSCTLSDGALVKIDSPIRVRVRQQNRTVRIPRSGKKQLWPSFAQFCSDANSPRRPFSALGSSPPCCLHSRCTVRKYYFNCRA